MSTETLNDLLSGTTKMKPYKLPPTTQIKKKHFQSTSMWKLPNNNQNVSFCFISKKKDSLPNTNHPPCSLISCVRTHACPYTDTVRTARNQYKRKFHYFSLYSKTKNAQQRLSYYTNMYNLYIPYTHCTTTTHSLSLLTQSLTLFQPAQTSLVLYFDKKHFA